MPREEGKGVPPLVLHSHSFDLHGKGHAHKREHHLNKAKSNVAIPAASPIVTPYTSDDFGEERTVDAVLVNTIVQRYEGKMDNDKFGGNGTVYFVNENVYSGEFENGMMHGRGVYMWQDGTRYEGDMRNNTIEGEGEYYWDDGSSYKGSVKNGIREGKGVFIFRTKRTKKLPKINNTNETSPKSARPAEADQPTNGQITQIDEMANGTAEKEKTISGDEKSASSEDEAYQNGDAEPISDPYVVEWKYEGEWQDGIRHGKGSWEKYEENICVEKYVGEWKDDVWWGYGTIIYRSGNEYRGNWAAGKREGRGTMIWYNKHEIYTGSWEGGVQSGWGTYFWMHPSFWPVDASGQITRDTLDNHSAEFKANRYEGLWERGQRNGFGTFHYLDGARYVGSWVDNLKHGRGKYIHSDGEIFDGTFIDDRPIGVDGPITPRSNFDTTIANNETLSIHLHLGLVEDIVKQQTLLKDILLRHISPIKRTYMQYSHPSHLLPWLSAMKCLKDSNIFSTQFSPAMANRIMAEIMQRDYGTDHPIYQNPHTSTHPILMREFLEWLVRVAHARPQPIQVIPPSSSTSSPSPAPSSDVPAKIECLLRDYIVKNCANRPTSSPSEVIMNSILQDYTMRLLRIYERFSRKLKLSLPDSSNVLQIFKKASVDTSLIIPLFSDEDGAFEIDVEVTFYEFLSVCGYFALHQQNQQTQQTTQQQQQKQTQQNQQSQLAQLLQLQQQQQLLFQQLQNRSFTPPPSISASSNNNHTIEDNTHATPFLDHFVMCVGEY